jgi:hypothetical protein
MIWKRSDIRRARQTPLKPVLEQLGYRLQPLQSGNFLIAGLSPETCHGVAPGRSRIIVKDHYWICADTGSAACPEPCRGGNAIDFFVRVKKTSFNEAMRLLTS